MALKFWPLLAAVMTLAACSLPRGAALQSEILREQEAGTATFQVVDVTRAAIPAISQWPASGWHGHYHWLDANGSGSAPVIRAGDRVDLVIWDGQENSLIASPTQRSVTMTGVEVTSGGSIFVPYAENVVIAGLTTEQARRRIQTRMDPIVPSAQVQLSVEKGPSSTVDVVAGTRNPGSFPLPDQKYTILSLIAAAGGVDPGLRNPVVRLLRGSETYVISAKRLFESARHNTTLYARDTVIIEQDDRSFTALGASGTEALIYFPDDDLTALEAMSLMGGLSDLRADPEGVLVLREYDAADIRLDGTGPERQQVIFSFDLTSADGLFAARQFQIHPDDTVLATESPVTAAQTILGLFGGALGVTARVNDVTN